MILRYIQSKEMSHDSVRCQSVAETCFSHRGLITILCLNYFIFRSEFSANNINK